MALKNSYVAGLPPTDLSLILKRTISQPIYYFDMSSGHMFPPLGESKVNPFLILLLINLLTIVLPLQLNLILFRPFSHMTLQRYLLQYILLLVTLTYHVGMLFLFVLLIFCSPLKIYTYWYWQFYSFRESTSQYLRRWRNSDEDSCQYWSYYEYW